MVRIMCKICHINLLVIVAMLIKYMPIILLKMDSIIILVRKYIKC